MSVPTSRTSVHAEVVVDYQLCTTCGTCVEVCKGGPLYIEGDQLKVDQTRGFGCIACAACEVFCPTDAIRVTGRDLFPEDLAPIAGATQRAGYDALFDLLAARRSTRNFQTREVDHGTVQQILDAASTAPVGVPPSDVGVLVFQTAAAVQSIRADLTVELRKWRTYFSPPLLTLMTPFIGRDDARMFKDFVVPAVKMYTDKDKQGVDWFFYNAPLALYFYGTSYSDQADPTVAATLAMLAGESLGLGTCMLGFPGYVFQYSPAIRRKYGLPKKIQPGLMVIFGYPVYHPRYAVHRRFREVRTFE